MRKVISIALFGDPDRKGTAGMRYHPFLATFVLAHHNLFERDSGWELHLHLDSVKSAGKYGEFAMRLQAQGLIVVREMGEPTLTRSMLWRMAPVFEPGADYVFCRDIDCVPMPRDRAICDVFIASNYVVHAAIDSLSHAGVMGGMSGFKCEAFRATTGIHSLDYLYTYAGKSEREWAQHGTDQLVLNRIVDAAPEGLSLLEHRYNGWHAGPKTKEIRRAGEYRCKSASTPMPDIGKSKLPNGWAEKADRLANHLGAAGYDIDNARAFWIEHGDPAITKLVRECDA